MRAHVIAVIGALALGLPGATIAVAQGSDPRSFPGDDPNESVRDNTPNDPDFDCAEGDDEDSGDACSNVFGEQLERFGFAPESTDESAIYKNPDDTQRQQEQNTLAGRNPLGQLSGVSADRAWKYSIGVPSVEVAILDTGIRWRSRELRNKVALNEDELPDPEGRSCESAGSTSEDDDDGSTHEDGESDDGESGDSGDDDAGEGEATEKEESGSGGSSTSDEDVTGSQVDDQPGDDDASQGDGDDGSGGGDTGDGSDSDSDAGDEDAGEDELSAQDDDCGEPDEQLEVDDFAGDDRVKITDGNDESDDILDASDLIAAFSDDSDDDDNGYEDDIAGWDFFDDDNDPYDASSYSSASNHGTGRAEEAGAETDNEDGGTGVCPRCQIVPLRVWDTFVVDTNNFAQGVLYATDNDVEVVEGAIGGLYDSRFGRQAFEHAYRNGTFMAIVSSDLNTADHNFPTTYDEAMMVQGTVADTHGAGEDVPDSPFGDLLNTLGLGSNAVVQTWFRNSGTTQYGGHAHIVMPAVTGSAATGQASGAAGLVASAARERGLTLQPNEIKQLITLTAEDVVPENTTGVGTPDPALEGWDQHFGYGRPDLGLALERIDDGEIPPQALITAPEWFEPFNVLQRKRVSIRARLSARDATDASSQDDEDPESGEENEPLDELLDEVPEELDGLREQLGEGPEDESPEDDGATGAGQRSSTGVGAAQAPEGGDEDPPGADAGPGGGSDGSDEGGGDPEGSDPGEGAPGDGGDPDADAEGGEDPDAQDEDGEGELEKRNADDDSHDGDYEWTLEWAPGIEPAEGEFEEVDSGSESGPVEKRLGRIDLEEVREALDNRLPGQSSTGEGGATVDPTAPSKGQNPDNADEGGQDVDPNEPAFTVRVRVEDDAGNEGEDRKVLWAYEDETLHEGWSRPVGATDEAGGEEATGGEASQRLFDLDGDNALDVVQADSSGDLQALRADGTPLESFNGGDPVSTGVTANVHEDAPSYDDVDPPQEVQRTPAIGDIDGDLEPEIVNSAGEHVYAWNADGSVVDGFPVRLDPDNSRPEDRTRDNHVKRGFIASPTLGDLNGDGRLEIVVPGLDQYVYVWDGTGSLLPGFPKELDDGDPASAGAEIINTAAIGDIFDDPQTSADDERPEIVSPTAEFDPDPDAPEPPGPGLAGAFGAIVNNVLTNALGGSGRVYALDAAGQILSGWPTEPGGALPDALPLVGPGVDHALGNVDDDPEPEVIGNVATGDVTATNGDGSNQVTYDSEPAGGENVEDESRVLNLFENAIVANLDGAPGLEVIKGGLTLNQLVNLGVAVGQNLPYYHVIQAWNGQTGASLPAFPQAIEDYQLLSSPAVADVSDAEGVEILAGTGLYLLRNMNAAGDEGSDWPKFTGGWIFGVPAVGDADGDGKLEVASLTREGFAFLHDTDRPACGEGGGILDGVIGEEENDESKNETNNEWWTSRHDEWSTGNYETDARPPGTPRDLEASRDGSSVELTWTVPGDDWLCAQSERYRIIASSERIEHPTDGRVVGDFGGPPASDAPPPSGEQESQTVEIGGGERFVAVLHQDEAGNWGHLASVRVRGGGNGGGGGDGDDDGGDGDDDGGGGDGGGGNGGGSNDDDDDSDDSDDDDDGGGSGGGDGSSGDELDGGQVLGERGSPACLPQGLTFVSTGLGPLRLGLTRAQILGRTVDPVNRTGRVFRYCVSGGGRTYVAFSRDGRARMVVSVSEQHRARGIGRGSSAREVRRLYPQARKLGSRHLTARLGAGLRVVFGVNRRGRVRYVAVVDDPLTSNLNLLRYYLRTVRLG